MQDSIENIVKELLNSGRSETEIRKFVRKETGLGKTRSNEIFNRIKRGEPVNQKLGDQKGGLTVLASKGYSYNKEAREYTVFLRKNKKSILVSEITHKDMMKDYMSDVSAEQISIKYGIPSNYIQEYKEIFGWTRKGIPITDEELNNASVEECVEQLISDKKIDVINSFQKKNLAKIVDGNRKWEEFQFGVLDPFGKFIENWAPKYEPYTPKEKYKSGHNLVVVLSDCHYGCYSDGKKLFRSKGHSTDYTVSCVKSYYQRVIDDINNLNLKIESVTILSLGDQIHTASPYSTTTKGTQVRSDFIEEEMFEIAFNSLTEFVYNVSQIAPVTKVIALKGNHCGQLDLILFKTLSVYFKDQKNISFRLVSAPAASFRERDTFCIATHGAHDSIKAKFGPGDKTQAYIQSLIIHSQEQEKGIVARACFAADLHHSEMKEYNDFTYHLCPSVVRDDEYADALGLSSRSAQTVFLIDDNGIKASFNYYFDSVVE